MRRGPSLKRKPEPDPLFNSVLVSQLTNQILLDGRKDTARNIVYSALELVEKQAGGDPLAVLKEAFENVKPQVETKSRREASRRVSTYDGVFCKDSIGPCHELCRRNRR